MADRTGEQPKPQRAEQDSLGTVGVPAEALFGPQTQRAVDNFPISPLRLPRDFIHALGLIKAAAARTNGLLGELPSPVADAIERAALRVASGEMDGHFVVDVFQTGSGTSTNMNANEVIARLCSLEDIQVHPNDQVNRSQSSNDVFPAAIHVSAALILSRQLQPALRALQEGLCDKAVAFHDVIKLGRTHLQDAVPMRFGDEFGGYARQVEASWERISAALSGIYELPLGGTAIGTGLNAPGEFGSLAIQYLSDKTSLPFRSAANRFEAQAARDAACHLSGALRSCAVSLYKIANDIRWLASGPSGGLGELRLPPVQPGSSIMPGKVNPVIAESTLMACVQVVGHDAAIAWSCAAGNFELNTMMPLIAYNLLDSIALLSNAARNFQQRCVQGLEVNEERSLALARQSTANVTALVPQIGYDKAAAIATQAHRQKRPLLEVAGELSGLPEDELIALLDPTRQLGKPSSACVRNADAAEKKEDSAMVDEMSEQSFPASDPPSY